LKQRQQNLRCQRHQHNQKRLRRLWKHRCLLPNHLLTQWPHLRQKLQLQKLLHKRAVPTIKLSRSHLQTYKNPT
jgi:hypothetical protein